MKRKLTLILLGAILIFLDSFGIGWSQLPDTIGAADSVKVEDVVTFPGDQVVVSVYEFNDEEIEAITLPLKYQSQDIVCDSVSFIGSRIDYINTKPVSIDTNEGTIKLGAISINEAPLSPGEGKLADLFFRVRPDASSNLIEIDTFSIEDPPFCLSFVYTYPSGPDSGVAVDLIPVFVPGSITIQDENLPPQIDALSSQYVNEGDSLIINVYATDPEEQPLSLGVLNSPPTASFLDLGDGNGQFIWVPDYYGPYSSTNSPFSVTFFATDGTNSAYQGVEINVINQNAPPILNLPDHKTIPMGMLLTFSVSASDPDKEPVSITLFDQPPGSDFDGFNPGIFRWVPDTTDTGEYLLKFVATDPNGGKDSGEVKIGVTSISGYTLNLGNVVGNLGGIVSLPVYLTNPDLVSGMDLLVEFDTTIIHFLEASKEGTRIHSWEYFTYQANPTELGQEVRIIGISDIQTGLATPPLDPGSGVVCYLKFMASTDLKYDGVSVEVKFKFSDNSNNTFSNPDGDFIPQEQITYNDGWILLKKPQGYLLGDLNLNKVPFEIGDVVRFANYFADPVNYGFNLEQMFNSDVNEDGIQATISDFVFMIRYMLSGGVSQGKLTPDGNRIEVEVLDEPSSLVVYINSEVEVGGVYFELFSEQADLNNIRLSSEIDSMNSQINKEGNALRGVVYSEDGNSIKPGLKQMLVIPKEVEGENIELKEMQLCDIQGKLLKVEIAYNGGGESPSSFSLSQNYPNPFNPETYIDFALPFDSEVSLKIFNVKGQLVRTLVQERMNTGTHTVRWEGRDDSGNRVSSGVYFYRLTAGEKSFVKKMVLLK
jgi:hypothetical protein